MFYGNKEVGRFCVIFGLFYSSSVSLSLSPGSIVYLGMMFGAFFWGGLSDKVGRKQCLLISMTVNGFFAFLSSFVQGYSMFLLCRMVSGFGWVLFFCVVCLMKRVDGKAPCSPCEREEENDWKGDWSGDSDEHLPVLMCRAWLLTCSVNDLTSPWPDIPAHTWPFTPPHLNCHVTEQPRIIWDVHKGPNGYNKMLVKHS